MDRETKTEIAVSIGAVGLMLLVLLGIGAAYSGAGSLSSTGGLALVGAIVFFVVLMAGVGYWLATADLGEDDAEDGNPSGA